MKLTTKLMIAVAGCGLMLAQATMPAFAKEKEPIRIGVIASLTGPYAILGKDGLAGVHIAVEEFGGAIAGHPIKLFVEDGGASPSQSVDAVQTLITRNNVDIILGPLSGAAGLAVANIAKEFPKTTFIIAGAAAEDITMRGVAPNVFRTAYTGAQPMFPFGAWAYENGIHQIAIVAADYAFPYAQVGGFLKTFCARGGEVVAKFWTPLGTSDYSSVIAQLPLDKVDAVLNVLGGTDNVNFMQQLDAYGLLDEINMLGGTITVDSTVLSTLGGLLEGVVSASIFTVRDTEEFKYLNKQFKKDRTISLFVENYYRAAKWAFLALQDMNGDIDNQKRFRKELLQTSFMAPASFVSFDPHHNVVTNVYLNKVVKIDGEWTLKTLRTWPGVSQFWTFDPSKYQKQPSYDRNYPSCPASG